MVTDVPVAPRVPLSAPSAPTATLPKLRLAGVTDNWPCAASVPESAMFSGELAAVDTTVSMPLAELADAGAKVTVNVRFCFGESVSGKLSPLTEKPAPLTFAAEMVTADPPMLVTVSERPAVLLFCTVPKESVDDVAARLEGVLDPVEPVGDIPRHPVSSAIPAATTRVPIETLMQPRYDKETRK